MSQNRELLAQWRSLKLLSPFKAAQFHNANEDAITRAIAAERRGPVAVSYTLDEIARVEARAAAQATAEAEALNRWRGLSSTNPMAAAAFRIAHDTAITAAQRREQAIAADPDAPSNDGGAQPPEAA